MRARRWRRAPEERQSGKPGPRGRPAWRTALRSGGKANPNSASERANSGSVNPGWTWIPEDLRWVMRLEAREGRERREGIGVGGDGDGPEAARADRRRSPAKWAGLKPVILRSTSTIVAGVIIMNNVNVVGVEIWLVWDSMWEFISYRNVVFGLLEIYVVDDNKEREGKC